MPKMSLEERLFRIDQFVAMMKQRVIDEEHAGRQEWDTWTIPQLLPRFIEEASEVLTALSGGLSVKEFVKHCADAANYAGILADIAMHRGLTEALTIRSPEGIQ